jgi:hypothetical protein
MMKNTPFSTEEKIRFGQHAGGGIGRNGNRRMAISVPPASNKADSRQGRLSYVAGVGDDAGRVAAGGGNAWRIDVTAGVGLGRGWHSPGQNGRD